jgi:hypothetical protein
MNGAIPLLPLYTFMGMDRDDFTFFYRLIKNIILTQWFRRENSGHIDLKETSYKNMDGIQMAQAVCPKTIK